MRGKRARSSSDLSSEDLDTHHTDDASDIKIPLCKFLNSIESGGSFATTGVYSQAPLPDLFLQGYGPIPLPLAQRAFDEICEEQTEDHTGECPQIEQFKDWDAGKYMRNLWVVQDSNFAPHNPAWNVFVQKIAVKTAQDLGVKPDSKKVKAERHRAWLWSTGASLRPYREISHVVGCFGRLMICLPAAHIGGKLLLAYGGEVKDFSTETSSSWGYSYIAWHNEVTVEFKSVDSGHRLMLEYDLILPPPAEKPSLANLYSEKGKLKDILAAWSDRVEKDGDFPNLLAYICDSHYKDQSLSLNVLRGNDRLRATCLEELCSQLGMGVYIADLDRTVSGSCRSSHPSQYGPPDGHDMDTVDDDYTTLNDVVNLAGKKVATDLAMDLEVNIVQDEPFDDDPDDEDYDFYDGAVTHYYRRTVLVMIPSVAKKEWLPQESKDIRPNKRKRGVEVIDLE